MKCIVRADLAQRVAALAEQHSCGLLSTWQAELSGIHRTVIERGVRAGLLVPVRRGVVRLAGVAPSPDEPIAAAVLAGGPSAAATRASALGLRPGLPTRDVKPQIVTVGRAKLRLAGVEAHTTRNLDAADVVVLRGIRTETFGRAVLSTIGDPRVHWVWIARVLDAGCRLFGDKALSEVESALVRAGARGHSGAARLRLLVDERREDGPQDMFKLQRRWMAIVEQAGLGGVEEHHVRVGGADRWLDRAWPEAMVCLEVKGFWPHGDRTVWDSDIAGRTTWSTLAGTSTRRPATRIPNDCFDSSAGRSPSELSGVCRPERRHSPDSSCSVEVG